MGGPAGALVHSVSLTWLWVLFQHGGVGGRPRCVVDGEDGGPPAPVQCSKAHPLCSGPPSVVPTGQGGRHQSAHGCHHCPTRTGASKAGMKRTAVAPRRPGQSWTGRKLLRRGATKAGYTRDRHGAPHRPGVRLNRVGAPHRPGSGLDQD